MNTRTKNALISVFNKDGIVEFAQTLKALGWNIYSSGGTATKLREAGVEVTDVADIVGGGAILGHKVVTLSRQLFAGILADESVEAEVAQMTELGLPIIDLVCVDCYPLADEIAKQDSTPASVLKNTDIGGPSMLRAAAKARRIVICEADDRNNVISWLQEGEPNKDNFLLSLAAKAEFYVANYCLQSAEYTKSLVA